MIRTFIIAVLATAGLLAGSGRSQAAVTHLLGPFNFGDVVTFGAPPTPGQGPFDNEDWNLSYIVANGQAFPAITVHMDAAPAFTALTLQVIRDAEAPTAPFGTPAGFTFTDGDPRSVALGDTLVSITLRIAGDLEGLPPDYSGNFVVTVADVASTPLPAALPLFATGLGALGLLGWRRKGRVTTKTLTAC